MELIDLLHKFYFVEEHMTINEIKDLYHSIIPEDKENTILKMFDYIDKYMIYYDANDDSKVRDQYQDNVIGLLYNNYNFSLNKIELDDKVLEELINTYANLRYSLYYKIVEFAYKVRQGKIIDRKEYNFVLYGLSSFNLESIYYCYIIKNNVRSTKADIKFMNMVINYIFGEDIISEDINIVKNSYDFSYFRKDLINLIDDDVKVLKKKT